MKPKPRLLKKNLRKFIPLAPGDLELFKRTVAAIDRAITNARKPVLMVRKIAAQAVRYRNDGRAQAIKNHPFKDVCEVSGGDLLRKDAVLRVKDPAKGYRGRVHWVCPKANNSGRRACSEC